MDIYSLRPLLPSLPNCVPRPHLDHNSISSPLPLVSISSSSDPQPWPLPSFDTFFTFHTHPATLQTPLHSPLPSISPNPMPIPSIPASRYLSENPPYGSCLIFEVRMCVLVQIPGMAQPAATRSSSSCTLRRGRICHGSTSHWLRCRNNSSYPVRLASCEQCFNHGLFYH